MMTTKVSIQSPIELLSSLYLLVKNGEVEIQSFGNFMDTVKDLALERL